MKVSCHACGFDDAPGRHFCSQCGAALVLLCPYCGAELSDAAGLCRQCGAAFPIDAASTPEAWKQRRAVTAAAFRASLAGLTAVNVQVEPVNADAERDGLTASELRQDVESALQAAGISVVTPTGLFARVPGTPFLHLDVRTHRLDARYTYSLRLELWQGVRLIRDASIYTLAPTWTGSHLIGTIAAHSLTDIRRTVCGALGEFTEAWRTASAGGAIA